MSSKKYQKGHPHRLQITQILNNIDKRSGQANRETGFVTDLTFPEEPPNIGTPMRELNRCWSISRAFASIPVEYYIWLYKFIN